MFLHRSVHQGLVTTMTNLVEDGELAERRRKHLHASARQQAAVDEQNENGDKEQHGEHDEAAGQSECLHFALESGSSFFASIGVLGMSFDDA